MIRIICMGDSTMQYNDCTTYPQTGWPQALARFLPRDSVIENFARNGRSTKSFIAEGLYDAALAAVKSGDYVLIEFGHNDEKMEDPLRGTLPDGEYTENLRRFCRDIKSRGAFPVVLSSIARRKFAADKKTLEATHGAYPEAARRVAVAEGVPYIDMDSLTREAIEAAGEEVSRSFFMNFDAGIYPIYPDGKSDNTHLRPDGAEVIAGVAAAQFARLGEQRQDYAPLSRAIIAIPAEQTKTLSRLPEEP